MLTRSAVTFWGLEQTMVDADTGILPSVPVAALVSVRLVSVRLKSYTCLLFISSPSNLLVNGIAVVQSNFNPKVKR